MEECVLLNMDHDVEIACRAAARTAFPFSAQAKALPRRNPRRNTNRDLAFTL